VPLQLMHLFVGQLSVCRRHDPLVCKFTIHRYVLPASKNSVSRLKIRIPFRDCMEALLPQSR
jgi:hypothetical protein